MNQGRVHVKLTTAEVLELYKTNKFHTHYLCWTIERLIGNVLLAHEGDGVCLVNGTSWKDLQVSHVVTDCEIDVFDYIKKSLSRAYVLNDDFEGTYVHSTLEAAMFNGYSKTLVELNGTEIDMFGVDERKFRETVLMRVLELFPDDVMFDVEFYAVLS